jgi:hypothetical protein
LGAFAKTAIGDIVMLVYAISVVFFANSAVNLHYRKQAAHILAANEAKVAAMDLQMRESHHQVMKKLNEVILNLEESLIDLKKKTPKNTAEKELMDLKIESGQKSIDALKVSLLSMQNLL